MSSCSLAPGDGDGRAIRSFPSLAAAEAERALEALRDDFYLV